jgi:hypothetical protein
MSILPEVAGLNFGPKNQPNDSFFILFQAKPDKTFFCNSANPV